MGTYCQPTPPCALLALASSPHLGCIRAQHLLCPKTPRTEKVEARDRYQSCTGLPASRLTVPGVGALPLPGLLAGCPLPRLSCPDSLSRLDNNIDVTSLFMHKAELTWPVVTAVGECWGTLDLYHPWLPSPRPGGQGAGLSLFSLTMKEEGATNPSGAFGLKTLSCCPELPALRLGTLQSGHRHPLFGPRS